MLFLFVSQAAWGSVQNPLISIDRWVKLDFLPLCVLGETKIRFHGIENPETVKKVLGLDANSFCLYAIAQNNPSGYFCRYTVEEDFRPDPCSKFGFQSYQWLVMSHTKKTHFCKPGLICGKKESASTVCQCTVILRNKKPSINFLVVSFIFAIDAISTETLT